MFRTAGPCEDVTAIRHFAASPLLETVPPPEHVRAFYGTAAVFVRCVAPPTDSGEIAERLSEVA